MINEPADYKTAIARLLKEDYKFRKKKSFYRIKNINQLAEVWGVCESTARNKLSGRFLITREDLEKYACSFHRDSDWINETEEEAMNIAKGGKTK